MNLAPIFTACIVLPVLLSRGLYAQENAASGDVHPALESSRAAAKELSLSLRSMLSKHLAAGGPTVAISICADSAQVVGKQIQVRHNLSVRRVSEKWRNVEDAPDSFEIVQLRKFAALLAEGQLADTLELFEVVNEGSTKIFRYMKPIITGEMCLGCHGDPGKMKGAVSEVIRRRYPQDKAINYKAGDLRGAVSVKKAEFER